MAVLALRRRLPKGAKLYMIEYWVYLPEPKLPKLEAIMNRMISENPHNRPGRPCIGAREGMLFTDIRLHMAIARRSKNPQIFRPDLFHQAVEPTVETLRALSEAQAIAKLRYVSEAPLTDTRHLQFMPHLADAVAQLSNGLAVFDTVSDQLVSAEEFRARLTASPQQERIDAHARVTAWPEGDGYRVETRGLPKVGQPELRSNLIPADERQVVISAFEEALGQLWKIEGPMPAELPLEVMGQPLLIRLTRKGLAAADAVVSRTRMP